MSSGFGDSVINNMRNSRMRLWVRCTRRCLILDQQLAASGSCFEFIKRQRQISWHEEKYRHVVYRSPVGTPLSWFMSCVLPAHRSIPRLIYSTGAGHDDISDGQRTHKTLLLTTPQRGSSYTVSHQSNESFLHLQGNIRYNQSGACGNWVIAALRLHEGSLFMKVTS